MSLTEEMKMILEGCLTSTIQTIETSRMIVGYVYFRCLDGRRVLVVHDLFVKRRYRNRGLAKQFIRESFDLRNVDVRVSINIMNDIMYNLITTTYDVKPIKKCLEYQIVYPSFAFCEGPIPVEFTRA